MERIVLTFCLISISTAQQFHPELKFDTSDAIPQEKANVNEMMARIGSASVLACDPIFGAAGAGQEATWYKDGMKIAEVTGERNAVYLNRSLEGFNRQVPEVGFLILNSIEKADEGDYWCIRKDNGQLGEIYRIKVAFMTPIGRDRKLITTPDEPFAGDIVEIKCTKTEAFPSPAINWLFNGKALLPSSNFEVASNGSLFIHRFSSENAGTYDCVLQNFAGKTKASVTLPLPQKLNSLPNPESQTAEVESGFLRPECVTLLKNSTLWFLIGCLSTCCLVLIYLFTGMICYRYHNRRPCAGRLPLWQSLLRADPALAPGFRKVIVPAPESRTQPPLISSDLP